MLRRKNTGSKRGCARDMSRAVLPWLMGTLLISAQFSVGVFGQPMAAQISAPLTKTAAYSISTAASPTAKFGMEFAWQRPALSEVSSIMPASKSWGELQKFGRVHWAGEASLTDEKRLYGSGHIQVDQHSWADVNLGPLGFIKVLANSEAGLQVIEETIIVKLAYGSLMVSAFPGAEVRIITNDGALRAGKGSARQWLVSNRAGMTHVEKIAGEAALEALPDVGQATAPQEYQVTLRPARIKRGKETVLEAKVTDNHKKPMPGIEVFFAVKHFTGGPTIVGSGSAKTGANGLATMKVSAGDQLGKFEFSAQVQGGAPATSTVTVTSAGVLGTGLNGPAFAAVAGGIAAAVAVPIAVTRGNNNRTVTLNPGSIIIRPPTGP
ncbi:MAG: hypothetical protein HYR55_14060 [Acidobacteria bacterium]|nr:hypothetical protein [Acidobacteriota bacterium]MBI3655881.1 hypothetical protein [Acidobacteriota bacterium]